MAESEIGALSVKIEADSKGLKKGLRDASKRLSKFSGKADKASKGLGEFAKGAKNSAVAIASVAGVVAAAGIALTVFSVKSAKARKETEIFARQANDTVEGFESLAFAAKSFGVEAENVADISKDLSDRLGEFASAQTGTFQDFLDVTKKTKKEGKELAAQWQHLSSQEVIGKVVQELEAVNATGAQTTFVMESLGNDLSKLTPLFASNSKELNRLADKYKKLTGEMELTDGEAADLKLLSESFDDLTTSTGKAAEKLAAQLAPAIDRILDSITKKIPAATKSLVEFIDSFGTDKQVITLGQQVIFLKEQIKDLDQEKASLGRSNKIAENSFLGIFKWDESIERDKNRIAEIIDQIAVYKRQLAEFDGNAFDAPIFKPAAILKAEDEKKKKKEVKTGFSLTNEQQEKLAAQQTVLDMETAMLVFSEDQRKAIRSGHISEEIAMFDEASINKLASVQAQQEELLLLYGDGNAQELALWQSLEDQKNAISEIGSSQRIDIAKKEASVLLQTQLSASASILGSLASFASKSFKTQKAFAIAQGTLGVAGAMVKALNSPLGFPANLGLVAAVAAQGASLIGTIRSSKPGSGSTPSVTGGGGGASSGRSSGGGNSSGNAPESRNISINLQGGGLMSTDQVRELIGQINESVGDGVQLITNGV